MQKSHPLTAPASRSATETLLATAPRRGNEMTSVQTKLSVIDRSSQWQMPGNGHDSQPPPRITAHRSRIPLEIRPVSRNRFP
jgi:hypothetical protein